MRETSLPFSSCGEFISPVLEAVIDGTNMAWLESSMKDGGVYRRWKETGLLKRSR